MKACHTDGAVILQTLGLQIRAGSRLTTVEPGWIVLDLAGEFEPLVKIEGFEAPRLRTVEPRRIAVKWPDMGTPRVGPEFWPALLADLFGLINREGDQTLFVGCFGGHGRTGTALAILGSLLDGIPPTADPVRWVRNTYCAQAVETYTQIDYIQAVTGRVSKSKPAPVKSAAWGGAAESTRTSKNGFDDEVVGRHPLSPYDGWRI